MYKRQEYIFPDKEVKKSSVRRRLDAQLDKLDDKELSVIEATVNGLCTVSYTHLDVYKRQTPANY